MALTIEELKTLIQNDRPRQLELKKTTGKQKDGMHTANVFSAQKVLSKLSEH